MSEKEAAEVLGITVASVKNTVASRSVAIARAFDAAVQEAMDGSVAVS